MKYIVRTTLERELHQSFEQINYSLLIDKEHNIREIFIKQLESISNDDVVLMEDDIILCKNFKEKIEAIIKKKPNEIINFFTSPFKYYTDEYREFVYNQCTYYPKEILQDIVKFYKNYKLHFLPYPEEYIQIYLKGKKAYSPRPCLIQHIDNKSLLNKHAVKIIPRRTIYFIDYLEDLNITYEEANTPENMNKLVDYMEESFKNL